MTTLAKFMDQHSLIEEIRAASLDVLDRFARNLIQEWLPTDYLQTLDDIDQTDALRVCLIVFILTATIIVPSQSGSCNFERHR